MSEPIQKHYRNCNICEAVCGIIIEHQGDQILSIRGNKDDVLSQGHICPKAVALQDFYNDPDRLKQPVKKTTQGWETISWEEALDTVASRIQNIQADYGNDSIGTYLGNPNAHKHGNSLFLPNLIRALKTRNRFSASSVDQLPHHFASEFMFGNGGLLPVADIDHTDFLIILGGNPLISNGSLMTAPNFGKRMKRIQKRGGKIVVIDPRYTETARKSDQHIFIKPGSDAYLLMSIVHIIFRDEKIKLNHLSEMISGIEELKNASAPYAPEVVSDITGVPSDVIEQLAADFTSSNKAALYSRMGASTQQFGGLCIWLTNVINILSGNLDVEGGAMFPQPALDYVLMRGNKKRPTSYGKYKSRVKGLPYYNNEFPVSTLADEILTPGQGQIRGMVTVAGNPILSCPNANKLSQAFEQLEFFVAIDMYINETTKHADIILPGTAALEESQYDMVFHNLAIRNVAKYGEALFPKSEDQKHDWEIIAELVRRLGGNDNNGMSPDQLIELGWKVGPHAQEELTIQKLLDNPNGIDLGPLQTCLKERLLTEDGMIQLSPPIMLKDLPRLEEVLENYVASSNEFPFLLIGRRLLRSHNSWCHNSYRLVKGPNECTLMMHPEDAASINISEGSSVSVHSKVGDVNIPVEITDEMMRGVVSIPHGWGHNDSDSQLSVANDVALGVNTNILSDDQAMDVLTGNAILNGIPVKISA